MAREPGVRGLCCAFAPCVCLLCVALWESTSGRVAAGPELRSGTLPRHERVALSPSDTERSRRASAPPALVKARFEGLPVSEARRPPPREAIAKVAGRRGSRVCVPEPESCDGVDNDCDGIRDEPAAAGCGAAYFDRDRDGFGAALAGCLCVPPEGLVSNGLDCDDTRRDVHPGVREVCDGEIDNDCDGTTDLCSALPHQVLAPGDLTISAVQDHMDGVDDELCEWFEIENRTSHTLELMGLEVRDDAFDGFRIRRSLVLEPGARIVLGRTGDPRANGGVTVDYVYSEFVLSNAGDSIELRSEGKVIARSVYTGEDPSPGVR